MQQFLYLFSSFHPNRSPHIRSEIGTSQHSATALTHTNRVRFRQNHPWHSGCSPPSLAGSLQVGEGFSIIRTEMIEMS